MVSLTIDGKQASVPAGTTILEAAQTVDVKIPTLCYNKHLKPYGGCRICLVEISGPPAGRAPKMVSSCTYPVAEGLVVDTRSEKVLERRRFVLKLLLAQAPQTEVLRELAKELDFDPDDEGSWDPVARYVLKRAPRHDPTKCILCGQCVRVCAEITGRHALCFKERGSVRTVRTPFERIAESCIGCGSCAYVCPTGAITVEEAD